MGGGVGTVFVRTFKGLDDLGICILRQELAMNYLFRGLYAAISAASTQLHRTTS
jgi:hypothetical protein